MKSVLLDKDIHYLLKQIALKKDKKINQSLYEAIFDLAKKHNVEIPKILEIYQHE